MDKFSPHEMTDITKEFLKCINFDDEKVIREIANKIAFYRKQSCFSYIGFTFSCVIYLVGLCLELLNSDMVSIVVLTAASISLLSAIHNAYCLRRHNYYLKSLREKLEKLIPPLIPRVIKKREGNS